MSTSSEESVPVFVSVQELEFSKAGRDVKLFTIYNPYPYAISFKVLCTSTHSYNIRESAGILQKNCCTDIVIRYIGTSAAGTVDKIKIEISRKGESRVIGSSVIFLKIVDQQAKERSLPPPSVPVANVAQPVVRAPVDPNSSLLFMTTLAGIVCALALMAPTVGDESAAKSTIPAILHLTLPQKLVAAYVLGLVTMIILRPL